MRAVQIASTGGPDLLQVVDVPLRDPGAGEVRIRHSACGINFIDTYHRTGLYPVTLPAVLGVEGAGVVEVVTSGKVTIEIGRRYRLEEAAQAHRDLEARATTGSSILVL